MVDGRPGFVRDRAGRRRSRRSKSNAVEQNLTGLRNRINQLGVAEPLVQKLGGSRIVIDLPGVQDSAEAKRKINKFANLEFRLAKLPANDRPLGEWKSGPTKAASVQLNKRVILTGDRVINAVQARDPGIRPAAGGHQARQPGRRDVPRFATAPNIGRSMAVIFIEHKPIVTVEEVDGETGGEARQPGGEARHQRRHHPGRPRLQASASPA